MSHNLNIVNGVVSMMYVGETPWHSLGTRLDNPATAEETIHSAGLGFNVEKMLIRTVYHNIPITNHFATVRTDTRDVLGIVGSRYEVIQNIDAFSTFDALVDEGEAIYHTAGALGKGERIWILAKLPDYIKVKGDDIVEKFLLLTNAHDGSSAVTVKLTPIRVVCQNTLSAALNGIEQQVHIKHTQQAIEKLKVAHEILGLSNKLYTELSKRYIAMSDKLISSKVLKQYIDSVFPKPLFSLHPHQKENIKETILELHDNGVGANWAHGTLWGAYNAVTEYVDHYRQLSKSESIRLKSIWYGSGEVLKKKAFNCAIAMMN